MRHMDEKENAIFDKAFEEFFEKGGNTEVTQEESIQSLVSKSNSFDRILKHLEKDEGLHKKYLEIRDKALEDNCQSVAVHICQFIDYLYEAYKDYNDE